MQTAHRAPADRAAPAASPTRQLTQTPVLAVTRHKRA